jgi:hypothetical protein
MPLCFISSGRSLHHEFGKASSLAKHPLPWVCVHLNKDNIPVDTFSGSRGDTLGVSEFPLPE